MFHKLVAVFCGLVVGAIVLLDWPPQVCIAVHLMTSLVTGFAWLEDRLMIALRAWVVALVFPVVGPLCLLLAQCQPGDGRGLIDSYREYIAYVPHKPLVRLTDPHEGLRREMAVQPLVDELYRGDFGARQAAADALAAKGDLVAIRLLQTALLDGDGETRLCASLALVKAEAAFADRLGDLRGRSRSQGATVADWLALATALGDYADSGLPAGDMALLAWNESATAVAAAQALGPDGDETFRAAWLQARSQLHLGAAKAAATALEGLLDERPLDHALRRTACEAWYQAGDFDRVAVLAAGLDDGEAPDPDDQLIAAYWSGHGR